MQECKYFESKDFWPKSYLAQTFSNRAYLAACASSELVFIVFSTSCLVLMCTREDAALGFPIMFTILCQGKMSNKSRYFREGGVTLPSHTSQSIRDGSGYPGFALLWVSNHDMATFPPPALVSMLKIIMPSEMEVAFGIYTTISHLAPSHCCREQ